MSTNINENDNKNTGVYKTIKKNGTLSYRVSITYLRKHISLGSYDNPDTAAKVYLDGRNILDNTDISVESYNDSFSIPYQKFIILINFRDNGLYLPTPIYMRKKYFEYFLSENEILKFDRDDLFFYSSHKIQKKGGYLFVSDYGSQYSILSRYGIKPFSVYARDYIMINNDKNDYRYDNIKIINHYMGVTVREGVSGSMYQAAIHINGNYVIGYYESEIIAAIAYNKAADILHANGFKKQYIKNYIISLDKSEYERLYRTITISDKITGYHASSSSNIPLSSS